jgi:NADH:ubiquinone oxidoreductase subunit E
MVKPKYHVLVCTSCRVNGTQKGYCHSKGSVNLVARLMEALDEHDLTGDVLVSNTGCFGICDKGPVMVVYPAGI